jgi:sigma-E factor negative regulatory protein RseB
MFDGSRSYERVQTLDGKPREFIRMRTNGNDEVQCLYPEARRIVIEHRAADEAFPGLAGVSAEAIIERYKLQIGAVERVAGIECRLLVLEPMDGMRYGYRLWIDQASGLLLRAQTLGERGEVLEQIAFTDIRIGERIDRARLKPAWPTAGWTIERSDYRTVNPANSGWSVPTPAGFQKTKEVSRRLGNSEAMQIVFSDGLATMSVFIEQSGEAKPADQVLSVGPTSAYTRRVADATVTVVGEVPPSAVRAVAASVEFRGPR